MLNLDLISKEYRISKIEQRISEGLWQFLLLKITIYKISKSRIFNGNE